MTHTHTIGVHVVRVGLFTVDQNGHRINKNSPDTTINQLKRTSQDMLVIPDSTISTSSGYPTIKAYLEAEALEGYILKHMDQSYIITYSQIDINNAK